MTRQRFQAACAALIIMSGWTFAAAAAQDAPIAPVQPPAAPAFAQWDGPRDCDHLTPPELDPEYRRLLQEEARKPRSKRRWKGDKPEVYTLVLEGVNKTFRQRLNHTYPGWLIRLCIDDPDYRLHYRLDVSAPTALTAPLVDITKSVVPTPPTLPTTKESLGEIADFRDNLTDLKSANQALAVRPKITPSAMRPKKPASSVPDLNMANQTMKTVIDSLKMNDAMTKLRTAASERGQTVAQVKQVVDTFNHSTHIFHRDALTLRHDLGVAMDALNPIRNNAEREVRQQDATALAAKVLSAQQLAQEWVMALERLKTMVDNKGKDDSKKIKDEADEIATALAMAQDHKRELDQLAAELQQLREEDVAHESELRNARAMATGLLSHFAQVDHNVFYIPVEKEKQYDVTVKFDRVTIVALTKAPKSTPDPGGAAPAAAAAAGENLPTPSDNARVFATVRYEPTGEDRRASFQVRGFTYFRINLGLAYTTLRSGQFTLAPNDAGAQVITRRGEQNILPMLVLSHYWCGADLREIQPYHRWKTCGWKNFLPTFAVGVPLSRNPIDNLFVGTLWQPVPGLALMGGVHLGRTWVLQRNFVEGQAPPPVAGQVFDINQVQDQRLRLGYFFGIAITDSIFVSTVSRLAGLNN